MISLFASLLIASKTAAVPPRSQVCRQYVVSRLTEQGIPVFFRGAATNAVLREINAIRKDGLSEAQVNQHFFDLLDSRTPMTHIPTMQRYAQIATDETFNAEASTDCQ